MTRTESLETGPKAVWGQGSGVVDRHAPAQISLFRHDHLDVRRTRILQLVQSVIIWAYLIVMVLPRAS